MRTEKKRKAYTMESLLCHASEFEFYSEWGEPLKILEVMMHIVELEIRKTGSKKTSWQNTIIVKRAHKDLNKYII